MSVRLTNWFHSIAILPVCVVALVSPAHAGSTEGAKVEVSETLTDDGRPCPQSGYRPVGQGGQESFLPIIAAVASSFASKAIDGFVEWLEKRKDRLDGTCAATFSGEFYNQDERAMAAKCVTFTAGTFSDDGGTLPKIYAEFAPVAYDGGTFTLKPVYLAYNETVAEEGRRKEKFTSLVLTYKYNAPETKDDDNNINSFELADGPTFTFTYGKLRPGTVLDYKALEGTSAGLGAKAPFLRTTPIQGAGEVTQPIAYQIGALWSESAEPSPLYTAAVGAISDNKEAIGKEIGTAIKEILGLNEEAEE